MSPASVAALARAASPHAARPRASRPRGDAAMTTTNRRVLHRAPRASPAAAPASPSSSAKAPADDAPPPATTPAPPRPTPSGGANGGFVQSIAARGRGDDEAAGVTLNDVLAGIGGARFFSPVVAARAARGEEEIHDAASHTARPLMAYLPGLDGTGFAASAQFESLASAFDLVAMNVPARDRGGFDDLVDAVVRFLEDDARNEEDRAVYLLGESMGGLVALGVAQTRPDLVDYLILVNPASSFDRSPWPRVGPLLPNLPEQLYEALPYALAPVLFDPAKLAEAALKKTASTARTPDASSAPALLLDLPGSLASAARELADLFPALGQLSTIIPRDTLAHRLEVLREGCDVVNAPGRLEALRAPRRRGSGGGGGKGVKKKPPVRILVVVGENDALIPSATEGARLRRRIGAATCKVATLAGASHAALQEEGVDLVDVMRENGFLFPATEKQTNPATKIPAAGTRDGSIYTPSRGETFPATPLGTAGTMTPPPPLSADPMFLAPGPRELAEAFAGLDALRAIVSPVFFSTRARDGAIVRGLDHVPVGSARGDRPVLLVGNHQTMAPDLGFLIEAFIREKGVIPRGLAHPVIAGGGGGRGTGAAAERSGGGGNGDGFLFETGDDAAAEGFGGGIAPFTSFGAVPVSGANFYRLLAANETVLLFPGGVREAFKRKDEEYRLFWPSQPEFVRMAVRHGATIVPFGAVGADDAVEMIADADDVANLPFGLGAAAFERIRSLPKAREVDTRVTMDGGAEETFVQPIVAPRGVPRRFYFKFATPIETAGLYESGFSKDDAAVSRLYAEVREEVEESIDWLLRRRGEDPFENTLQRVVWERATGEQAPTFRP